ncbi:MAG: ribosome biogenesis GTP-binding protein YihA/YsxC [Eubacteriales bacterium]|nr:ribosome biogenesis GTP-binding protein YihA/YsxC [Eubacteriales bacterium]
MEIRKAEFIKSVYDYTQAKLPPMPEIALVGRSNVGKSSLINTLCTRNALAKVSSTPGKTRAVNYFCINDAFYLVDLPGYGFANVSKKEKESWGQVVNGYLEGSEQLKHLFLLMDIRREPNDDDRQMAWWAQHYQVPCTIVATKCDKIAKSKRKPQADKLSDQLSMTFRTRTICVSSLDKTGKLELISRMGEVLRQEDLTVPEQL